MKTMMQIASSFFVYENDLKTKHKKNKRKNQFESDQQAISSTKYSKRFWQDNPIVKRTPLEEEIIESFDRDNSFGNFLKR
jgi:hypothetical protein